MKNKELNWTLLAMKILRLPSMQKLNPYVEVRGKQLDALEDYLSNLHALKKEHTINAWDVLEVLKANA